MLAFVACGKGQAHFDGNGISFDYPSNWHVIEGIQPAPSASGPTRMQVGFDQNNAAVVVITHLSKPVTAQDFQQTEGALIQVIQQGAQRRGGTLSSPSPTTLGGLAAFTITVSGVREPTGAVVSSRLVVAIQGATEYFVNCEYTADHVDDIQKGCDVVVQTFQITGSA